MVNYVCKKCNKIFNRKSNYQRHLNRKFPCEQWKSDEKKKCKKVIFHPHQNAPFGAPAPKKVQMCR